jgi:hypothetical protein
MPPFFKIGDSLAGVERVITREVKRSEEGIHTCMYSKTQKRSAWAITRNMRNHTHSLQFNKVPTFSEQPTLFHFLPPSRFRVF